jgi:hypothetical protein
LFALECFSCAFVFVPGDIFGGEGYGCGSAAEHPDDVCKSNSVFGSVDIGDLDVARVVSVFGGVRWKLNGEAVRQHFL